MKKYFALFIAIVAMACMFTSCNKDEKSSGVSLAGTSWKYDGTYTYEVMRFVDGSHGKLVFYYNSGSDSVDFAYTYNPPKITIVWKEYEEGYFYTFNLNGYIYDNVMSLYDEDGDDWGTYIKM